VKSAAVRMWSILVLLVISKLSKSYGWFHTFLNERDRGLYQRFLPRDLQGLALRESCGQ
jgi:hypothetical protein